MTAPPSALGKVDEYFAWAADDENGRVVPPGIYLLRIDVAVDSDSEVKRTGVQRLLHVAY